MCVTGRDANHFRCLALLLSVRPFSLSNDSHCRASVLQQRSGSFTSTAGKGIDCRASV